MKLRLLLFAAALLGAFPSPGYTPEEEALARELAADPGIRDRARGTPAEFMANQRGWMEDGARALLDGSASPERKARIVALYSRILRDIRRGLDWKEPATGSADRRRHRPRRVDRGAPFRRGIPS